jgi:tetratricopeptide (TPR) repeat protein
VYRDPETRGMLAILPPGPKAPTRDFQAQIAALACAIEARQIGLIKHHLLSYPELAGSSDPEHLGTLLIAESVLAASRERRTPAIQEVRESVLLAVMLQSRALNLMDIQMAVYSQFAVLLAEKGDGQSASRFTDSALQIQRELFGDLVPLPVRPTVVGPRQSSHHWEGGGVGLDFKSIASEFWFLNVASAAAAIERGREFRSSERWREASGKFLTAYLVLECNGEGISDAVLVRARAAAFLAESYVRLNEFANAIPYAKDAVRIYEAQPYLRVLRDYIFALNVLFDAYATGPEFFEERRRIERLLDSFPDQ